MSIKITVDNNFFDNYEKHQNVEVKHKIKQAFISRRLSFYPSLQLISELVSIYQTKRRDLLTKYAQLFLDIKACRCFNDWNRIIRSELGLIQTENIFLENRYFRELKSILERLSQGYIRKDVKDFLIEAVKIEKDKDFKKFKQNQNHHFKLLKEQKIKTPNMTFEDFFKQEYAVKIRRDLIKHLFDKAGKPITEQKIDKILDNSVDYPYFYTSSRVFMGIFYRHILLKRGVSEGDSYDQYYLIYLTRLDYLVSEDGGLKEFAKLVFDKSKVINFSELINLIQQ